MEHDDAYNEGHVDGYVEGVKTAIGVLEECARTCASRPYNRSAAYGALAQAIESVKELL